MSFSHSTFSAPTLNLPTTEPTSVHDLPEELLERILALALSSATHTANGMVQRPEWRSYQSAEARLDASSSAGTGTGSYTSSSAAYIFGSATSSFQGRASRISPLYVSQQWSRVGTPLVYREIELTSCRSARLLLRTLTQSSQSLDSTSSSSSSLSIRDLELAKCVRSLSFTAIWPSLGGILAVCAQEGSLRVIDLTLDAGCCDMSCPCTFSALPSSSSSITDDEDEDSTTRSLISSASPLHAALFTPGLSRSLKVLKVRKAQGVYLTAVKVRYVLSGLADAVQGWDNLENVELLFRMSDDSNARTPVGTSALDTVAATSSSAMPSLPASSPASSTSAASAHHSSSPPRRTHSIRRNTDACTSRTHIQPATSSSSAGSSSSSAVGLGSGSANAQVQPHGNTNIAPVMTRFGVQQAQAQSLAPVAESAQPQQLGGPVSRLTTALSAAPGLRSFTTYLPSLWNNTVLVVSGNEKLEKIILVDGDVASAASPFAGRRMSASAATGTSSSAGKTQGGGSVRFAIPDSSRGEAAAVMSAPRSVGITATGMFMMEARKHSRLAELIRAGTPIMRSRAYTHASLVSSGWGIPTKPTGFVIRK